MACTPPFCLGTGGWCGCNCGCCPPCPAYKSIEYKFYCGSDPLVIPDPCATNAFRKNGIVQDEGVIQAQATGTAVLCDLFAIPWFSPLPEGPQGAQGAQGSQGSQGGGGGGAPVEFAAKVYGPQSSWTASPPITAVSGAQAGYIAPVTKQEAITEPTPIVTITRTGKTVPRGKKVALDEIKLVAQAEGPDPCEPRIPATGPYSINVSYSGCGLVGTFYSFVAVGSGTLFVTSSSTVCGGLVGLANGNSSSIELQDCDAVTISFGGTFTNPCCFCCQQQIIYTLADHCGGGTVNPCNPTFRITNTKTGKVVNTNRYALLNKVKKTLRYTNPKP